SGQLTRARLASTSSLVTAIEHSRGKRLAPPYGAPSTGQRGAQRGVRRVDAAAAPSQSLLYMGTRNGRGQCVQGGDNGEGCVSGSRRHGLPHGRASQGQGRPRAHGL